MLINVVGLGKMGHNLALNIQGNGYDVRAYDIDEDAVKKLEDKGIESFLSIDELLDYEDDRKIIFLMIPSGEEIDHVIESLIPKLEKGDIIIDGGNSNFNDSIRRFESLDELGIEFLDCGISGGPAGALNGVCTMIGGKEDVYEYCEDLFKDISVDDGYLYTGESGSGHFTKMIHNGIEYGMMQSIAEGFEVMHKSDFDLDYEKVAKLWNNGSVIRSWLMELVESAFSKDPNLDKIKGIMHSSGEGKWTVETALDYQVSTPVIALSLMMRYRSLEEDTFSGKIVAALRNEFGGHEVEKV